MNITFNDFSRIFQENLIKRSRTAKGISDTSSSTDKKKLLKSGNELRAQVEKNTKSLIESIWNGHGAIPKNPYEIRAIMEHWYDIINDGLQDPDAYEENYKKLEKAALSLRQQDRCNWRVNRRYRVWTPPYINADLTPLQLEFTMDQFYEVLLIDIGAVMNGDLDQAEILAYADCMIDGVIHPWADGCGRNATAAIMWLSLLRSDFQLPVFAERDEHYRTIRDLTAHATYFEECLAR